MNTVKKISPGTHQREVRGVLLFLEYLIQILKLVAAHHEVEELDCVFRFVGDDFDIIEHAVGEGSGQGKVLGNFGFQVDAVAFVGDEFDFAFAAVENLEEAFEVSDII